MQINDKSGLTAYQASPERYDRMSFRRAGKTGLKLPALSLGLWHNFGYVGRLAAGREILRAAFDHGIVHWDLANNYGPPYGSAEENFCRLLHADFAAHRDELVIATKAGFDMWPGPYGRGGSRKYLVASLDQSLLRMGLDYVDIFYHPQMSLVWLLTRPAVCSVLIGASSPAQLMDNLGALEAASFDRDTLAAIDAALVA